MALANGSATPDVDLPAEPQAMIDIPANWTKLCKDDPAKAKQEQLRVRHEFQKAFASGLVAAAFERSAAQPRYLLYRSQELSKAGFV
jgi:predicted GNAT superfamily acetyltransferase